MNKLMTPEQTSKLLGVALSTLYGWTSDKKIPFRKVGRLVRFDPAEVDLWTQGGGSYLKFKSIHRGKK